MELHPKISRRFPSVPALACVALAGVGLVACGETGTPGGETKFVQGQLYIDGEGNADQFVIMTGEGPCADTTPQAPYGGFQIAFDAFPGQEETGETIGTGPLWNALIWDCREAGCVSGTSTDAALFEGNGQDFLVTSAATLASGEHLDLSIEVTNCVLVSP